LQVATHDAGEAQVQPSQDVSQIPPSRQKVGTAMRLALLFLILATAVSAQATKPKPQTKRPAKAQVIPTGNMRVYHAPKGSHGPMTCPDNQVTKKCKNWIVAEMKHEAMTK
jgi:hypothetical protein